MKCVQIRSSLLIPALLVSSVCGAQQPRTNRVAMPMAPMPIQRAAPTPAPDNAATYPFIKFRIATGGDDLRSSSGVEVRIAFSSDHQEQHCDLHARLAHGIDANNTWENQSTHETVCKLDQPRTLEELKNARWVIRMDGNPIDNGQDNWNIKSIDVTTLHSRDVGQACVLSVHAEGLGDPDLIRLTGSQPSATLSSYPNRCG